MSLYELDKLYKLGESSLLRFRGVATVVNFPILYPAFGGVIFMEKNSLITATKIATIIAVDLSALGITYKVESVLPQYGLDRLQGISSLIFLIGIVGVQIWLLSN